MSGSTSGVPGLSGLVMSRSPRRYVVYVHDASYAPIFGATPVPVPLASNRSLVTAAIVVSTSPATLGLAPNSPGGARDIVAGSCGSSRERVKSQASNDADGHEAPLSSFSRTRKSNRG